jgi:hypothetical protein
LAQLFCFLNQIYVTAVSTKVTLNLLLTISTAILLRTVPFRNLGFADDIKAREKKVGLPPFSLFSDLNKFREEERFSKPTTLYLSGSQFIQNFLPPPFIQQNGSKASENQPLLELENLYWLMFRCRLLP